MPVDQGPPGWWVAWLVFIVLLGIGSAVVRMAVRGSVLRKGGLSPFVDREQLEVKLAQSLDRQNVTEPRKTIEERLAELTDLHQRGVISDEELRDARARVLSDG